MPGSEPVPQKPNLTKRKCFDFSLKSPLIHRKKSQKLARMGLLICVIISKVIGFLDARLPAGRSDRLIDP
jgi:hypothetical protein